MKRTQQVARNAGNGRFVQIRDTIKETVKYETVLIQRKGGGKGGRRGR
jgi:hypothetical protein